MQSALSREQRIRVFEEFEQRLVMSAQALTELGLVETIDPQTLVDQINQQNEVTTLGYIDAQPEVGQVHDDFGFDGTGQTVAVIDSGIAWDHYALGGGFGEGHRVVGGWDFAENDSNPYDDGPAGYHGTHVAGIIGSNEATNSGISPGVDLVGLRVFDDAGNGNLDWVEQALNWVHENRNSFEHPITTVNLSLGTDWNADNVPNWSNLENEFAQLEADGIFISVASGNAYESFNENGLSYPASSPFVVPVASHDSSGNMSEFSQRADGVLVAPGETVRSTVPDHLFGTNNNDRFLSASGTSMAAPYVAGASALLRQANEFMGVQNINQDLLYQQFRETADQILDSATGGHFYRINLRDAIDSIIGDLQGDHWNAAFNAGTIGTGSEISGTVGSLNDKDVFSFTASSTGVMTFDVETTHDLAALLSFQNANAQVNGDQVTLNVVAGQEYKFSIKTSSGIGHYKIGVDLQAGLQAKNWGTVASSTFVEQVKGASTFQLNAFNAGFVTLQAHTDQSGPLKVEIYNSKLELIATKQSTNGDLRLDAYGKAGETYYVKATAANSQVRFDVTNLVSLSNGHLNVSGTSGNDNIQLTQGQDLRLQVNGLFYQMQTSQVDSVSIVGNQGNDSISISLGARNDQVTVQTNAVGVTNQDYVINATGFESINIDTGSGFDRVVMMDSAGNDLFENNAKTATLSGVGFNNTIANFEQLTVVSSGGVDIARLNGTAGADRFASNSGNSFLKTDQVSISALNFDRTFMVGKGGNDLANLSDSAGVDQFTMQKGSASLVADSFRVWVNQISRINAISSSGDDSITFNDSAGDDMFRRQGTDATMSGEGYFNYATGFQHVAANASSGNDIAQVSDTRFNDVLVANSNFMKLSNAQGEVVTSGFDRVNVVASHGGFDVATINGTQGSDSVYADLNSTTVIDGADTVTRVVGFDRAGFDGRGGVDSATLAGSSGNESLAVDNFGAKFKTAMQELGLQNVEQSNFKGNGGVDEVAFADFDELDLLAAIGDKAVAYLANHQVSAIDFDILEANAKDGASSNYDFDAVDYLYMLRGNWNEAD